MLTAHWLGSPTNQLQKGTTKNTDPDVVTGLSSDHLPKDQQWAKYGKPTTKPTKNNSTTQNLDDSLGTVKVRVHKSLTYKPREGCRAHSPGQWISFPDVDWLGGCGWGGVSFTHPLPEPGAPTPTPIQPSKANLVT